jgi:hypothetical protein
MQRRLDAVNFIIYPCCTCYEKQAAPQVPMAANDGKRATVPRHKQSARIQRL